jgi:hypothetical protein
MHQLGSNGFSSYYNSLDAKPIVGQIRKLQGSKHIHGFVEKVTDNLGNFVNERSSIDEIKISAASTHDMVEVIAMDKIRYWIFVRSFNSKDPTDCARYMWTELGHLDWATKWNGSGDNNFEPDPYYFDPKTYEIKDHKALGSVGVKFGKTHHSYSKTYKNPSKRSFYSCVYAPYMPITSAVFPK